MNTTKHTYKNSTFNRIGIVLVAACLLLVSMPFFTFYGSFSGACDESSKSNIRICFNQQYSASKAVTNEAASISETTTNILVPNIIEEIVEKEILNSIESTIITRNTRASKFYPYNQQVETQHILDVVIPPPDLV